MWFARRGSLSSGLPLAPIQRRVPTVVAATSEQPVRHSGRLIGMSDSESAAAPSITSLPNGPYLVRGGVPLVRNTAVTSEHGEPLAWKSSAPLDTTDSYALCRCGQSANKPFCDGTHATAGFDGTDAATGTYADRSTELGGTTLTVRDDRSICVHAGFCGNRVTTVWDQVAGTDDSLVRMAVIAEIEKCPSGALTYRFDGDDDDAEVDRPVQVGVIDDGPLWVTGGIGVTTSGGEALETRARVTLCRCGASGNKPLCDGSHKDAGFTDS